MKMKLWDEALREVLERVHPLSDESVPLAEARGRFLREVICADADVPAFDLSMMDGYAVGEEISDGAELRVAGATSAGETCGLALRVNEARRIFTGAPLPPGATRVVPQEEIELISENRIQITKLPTVSFVRSCGSEARNGDVILRSGQWLGPVELSILAGLGQTMPRVGSRPKIAHLVLGDELVDAAETPTPGKIRDTNSMLIRALLEQNGTEMIFHRHLSDNPAAISAALNEVGSRADVILFSGGASVGDHDHARPTLQRAGFTFLFEQINFRPGKPTAIAFRDRQIAICLPGNPVSHLAVFHLMVRPVLMKLAGASEPMPAFLQARLCEDLSGKPNSRHTFWPAICNANGIRPLRFLSSGDTFSLAGINALISLPPDVTVPAKGSEVSFIQIGI